MENKINIDFNYYKTFYYVAKCGNFSLAAKELGVSQPAVSYNIAELEKALGTQIFIRAGKKIELTRSGEVLLDYVDDCFNTLVLAENKFLKDNSTNTQIRIGVQSHIMRALSNVHKVIENYNNCNIIFYDNTSEELIKKVQLKEFDFAIISGEHNIKGLSCVKIGDLHMSFVARKDYVNKVRIKNNIDEYKFALPLSTTRIRKELDRLLLQNNITINPSYEFNSNQICLSLLNHLECIYYIPLEVIRKDLNNGEYVIVDLGIESKTIPINLIYNEKYTNSTVQDFIKDICKNNLQ